MLHDANASAFWVDIPDGLASRRHSRDPKDDMFIHAAVAATSARLVSGDEDLLCLHPLEGLHILSPRAALEELTRVGG